MPGGLPGGTLKLQFDWYIIECSVLMANKTNSADNLRWMLKKCYALREAKSSPSFVLQLKVFKYGYRGVGRGFYYFSGNSSQN